MKNTAVGLLLLGATALVACQDNAGQPLAPSNSQSSARSSSSTPLTGTPTQRAEQIVAKVNARLEASGSTVRMDDAWMFAIGRGVEPYRRLRNTSGRWINPTDVTYMIDQDYTKDVPAAQVLAAIRTSFERHDAVGNITLNLTEVPFNGQNNDIVDGIVRDREGNCVDVIDVRSPRVLDYDPATGSVAIDLIVDNLFGGWLDPAYFEDCLGSANIIGVTYSFSDVDGTLGQGLDGYRDRVYTEQLYNTVFPWVNGGSVFLSPTNEMDIQSIVTHEVGHAMGLGHFGGPNTNEPFKLQPNGTVFDPEAIMNPFYLGGDKRELYPTDIAGLETMYATQGR